MPDIPCAVCERTLGCVCVCMLWPEHRHEHNMWIHLLKIPNTCSYHEPKQGDGFLFCSRPFWKERLPPFHRSPQKKKKKKILPRTHKAHAHTSLLGLISKGWKVWKGKLKSFQSLHQEVVFHFRWCSRGAISFAAFVSYLAHKKKLRNHLWTTCSTNTQHSFLLFTPRSSATTHNECVYMNMNALFLRLIQFLIIFRILHLHGAQKMPVYTLNISLRVTD